MTTSSMLDLQPGLVPPAGLLEVQKTINNVRNELQKHGLDTVFHPIVVIAVGDQSSGKSSLLASLSGIAFPVKDTACTSFNTEIELVYATDNQPLEVTIIPASDRPEAEQQVLRQWKCSASNMQLHDVMQSAREAMDAENATKFFRKDRLKIRIFGPSCANLTIVDLPGVIHSPGAGQDLSDVDDIKENIKDYMSNPRGIILAVVPADRDLAANEVLRFIQENEQFRNRSMAVITKPDAVEETPNRAAEMVTAASNKNPSLRFGLGWHVCRTSKLSELDLSTEEKDMVENRTLAGLPWSSLPSETKGRLNLIARLTRIVHAQAEVQIEPIMAEIKAGLDAVEIELQKLLVEAAGSMNEGDLYRMSFAFSQATRNISQGLMPIGQAYSPNLELRKRLEVCIRDFQDNVEFEPPIETVGCEANGLSSGLPVVNRMHGNCDDDLITSIADVLEQSYDTPGQFSIRVVSDLFYQSCRHWPEAITALQQAVSKTIRAYLKEVIDGVCDPRYGASIWKIILEPALVQVELELSQMAAKKLEPLRERRPVAIDRALAHNIIIGREKELRKVLNTNVSKLFEDGQPLDVSALQRFSRASVDQARTTIVKHLTKELSIHRMTASEILQVLQFHRQMQLDKLVSHFDLSSFDDWVIAKLHGIFSIDKIKALSVDELSIINPEDVTQRAEQVVLRDRRTVLQWAYTELSNLCMPTSKRRSSAWSQSDDGSAKKRRHRSRND